MATLNDLTISDSEEFYKKHARTIQSVMVNMMDCPPAMLADLVVMVKSKDTPGYSEQDAKALTLTEAITILGGSGDPLENPS